MKTRLYTIISLILASQGDEEYADDNCDDTDQGGSYDHDPHWEQSSRVGSRLHGNHADQATHDSAA